jgi:DNA-directed RNA polymerase specialized sigma24 family protein
MSQEEISRLHKLYLSHGPESNAAGWQLVEIAKPIIEAAAERQSRRLKRKSATEDLIVDLSLVVLESLKNWNSSQTELAAWVGMVLNRRAPKIANRKHGDTMVSNGTRHYEIRDTYEHDFESVDTDDQKALIADAMATVLNDTERSIVRGRANEVPFTELGKKHEMSHTEVLYCYTNALRKIRRAIGEYDD